MTREDRILFLRSLLAGFAQVRVEGASFLPEKGGAVLVCNHTDISDGFIQLLYTPRPLVFLAKSELFDTGKRFNLDDFLRGNEFLSQVPGDLTADILNLAGQFILDVDAMPIIRNYRGEKRSDARGYYNDLLDRLKERLSAGEVVAIYPEGRRSRKGLLPFRGYAARVALAARVPVVPAFLSGNTGLGEPAAWARPALRAVVYKIGAPILPDEFPQESGKRAIKRLTSLIQDRVRALGG